MASCGYSYVLVVPQAVYRPATGSHARQEGPQQSQLINQRCRVQVAGQVEYAVIPTELDETADVHGDDLSDTAQQCRFRLTLGGANCYLQCCQSSSLRCCQDSRLFWFLEHGGATPKALCTLVTQYLVQRVRALLLGHLCGDRRCRPLVSCLCIGTWVSGSGRADDFGSRCTVVHQGGRGSRVHDGAPA